MGSSTAPNFCSQCGARLRADDAHCSQCGVAVGGSSGRRGSRTRNGESYTRYDGRRAGGSRDGFRRRLEKLTAEGWEIEGEYGDRTVLVDRGIGSIGIHVLLLVFTGGLGNLLYGWYSYSMNAERIELHADGARRRLNRTQTSETEFEQATVNWAFSLLLAVFLLFLGVAFLGSSASAITVAIGLACLLGTVAVLPPARRRLAARRSIGTFGRVRETDERVVERPETPCSLCAAPVDQGVERRYGERAYVAGIPIRTHEHGRNVYCRDCASGDSFDDEWTEEGSDPGSVARNESA